MNSLNNKFTIEAYEKGYRIDKSGNIISPFKGIIKGRKFNNGRIAFGFRTDSYKYPKAVYVHKLQAYQKFGDDMFKTGIIIRHLDGNELNNSWDNIYIGTQSDNMMDRSQECRQKSATLATRKMQDNNRTYEQRCLIYEDLKNNIPYSEIMLKHDISSKGTLSFMKNKSLEYQEYLNK